MIPQKQRHTVLFAAAFLALGAGTASAAPVTFTASGAAQANIQAAVDAFRLDLGALNANVAGSFGTGRREINWDGVPDALSAPNALPANFFNVNSPRGVVFTTPGSGFAVSARQASGTPVRFGNVDVSYTAQFQTFSAERLFTATGSNIVDVNFFVPGTATSALTRGFGSVFADVDAAGPTTISYFDVNNALLDTLTVLAGPNGGLSFLGADYGAAVVSRVRITAGNAPLGAPESANDLVVMDDFVYAEPVTVPEPASLGLLVLGLGLASTARLSASRRRR